MRIQLQLDHVQVRGGERIEDPTHWPVFFAADETPLLALAGDVAASGWMHAPGAAAPESTLSWRYTAGPRTLLPSTWIGFALLFTAGGAKDPDTLAAYRSLQAGVHALVLGHAARQSGLAPLLAAFGGAQEIGTPSPTVDLDRLRKGVDPERLRNEIDQGLVEQFEFFRDVGGVLRGATSDGSAPPGPAFRRPSDSFQPLRPAPVVGPSNPLTMDSRLARGTVVAVTLQAWPVGDIPLEEPLEFDRPLPARNVARVSLRLSGRLSRES